MVERTLLAVRPEIASALAENRPVVALETAVVTHGLPAPSNLEAVRRMEAAIRQEGATPATCLCLDGQLVVGASPAEVETAAGDPAVRKAAVRDLGYVLARHLPAGLTVSATLLAAAGAGIRVFATGGIGGVHLDVRESGDISSDLAQLARSPVVTVCAGSKSVLDIPRTLELLETLGVPVYGFQTEIFPAFYLRSSGRAVTALSDVTEVAAVALAQWRVGQESGLVLGNPVPAEGAITPERWQDWLQRATGEAAQHHVQGPQVTPFLLSRVAEYSGGETVRSNLALLAANARLAGRIAAALAP